jgi:hypothetical protein
MIKLDRMFAEVAKDNEDIVPGFAGQGPVDVQSLETEIGKELYREGERNLPVEESIEVAKELYGERDSFVQDDQTRQDVPSQTFTGQDLTEQGPVDVQSLETEIGKELYREGERNLPVEESIEVAKELYGERDSFVQDDQTRQDVPSQTFTGQDLTEQGPVDVQSLETEIGKELYREGERNLPVEESIEVAKELYGERDSFVQDDQTRQDVPSQTFTGQDLTEQGPVDVQSLETEIGKELYREGERNLPVEESIEVAKELYGERDSFVQNDQTRQDVPSQTFTGQDLTEQGPVDVQTEEVSGGKELTEYDPGFVSGQTGQDVVPGLTEDIVPGLAGQGPVDVQTEEVSGGKSNVLGGQPASPDQKEEAYQARQGERNLPVQEPSTMSKDVQSSSSTSTSDKSEQSNQFSNPIAQLLYTLGHGFTIATLPFSYLSNLYNYLLDGLFVNNRKVESDNQSTSSVPAEGVEVTKHQSKDIKQKILEKSGENFKQGIGIFLRAVLDKMVLNYTGINMNVMREIDINLKFFDNINSLNQNLNLHGISAVMEALKDPKAREELLKWLEQLQQSKIKQDEREIAKQLYKQGERDSFVQDGETGQDVVPSLTQSLETQSPTEVQRPNNPKLVEFIDIIEQMEIKDLGKIIESIKSLDNDQSRLNDSIARLVSSIWDVDVGLASLLIQIQQDPQKANNLKSQLEKLYVESYFNRDNMRLSEEERRTYTIIYNALTTNMTMEKIHLVESINVLRKYELYRLFRQLEAEIGMDKEINAQDLQEKLRESLQSINDKYGLDIFTQDEIESNLKGIRDNIIKIKESSIQGGSSSAGSSRTTETSLGGLSVGLNSNDILLDPKIAKAFLKGLSMYYGSLGDIIDNEDSWAKKSNQIFLLGIRNILDQKDIDENTKNQLIDISVRIMLNDYKSLERIIDSSKNSLPDDLIRKLENRAKLIELIRKQYSRSSDTREKMIYYSFMKSINLDELLEEIFATPNRIPNDLTRNKENYMLNDEELIKLTESLKSALDADLFTLSLRVLENKNLNIIPLDRVLPKYLDKIPGLISEKTPLGFFYDTQDPAFMTKLNQALVGNHLMGRIRGWTEVQQIQTVLTSFAYELIPLDYQISIVDRFVYIKKGDETIQTLHLDRPVENISEIRLLAKDGQMYLQYDDQILPTGIKIDPDEKIKQMRFMTKDGKLYAVYGDKSMELRWEYIFTPIMHRTPLHVFNLNSKTPNEFIQQLIQEMGNEKLSYEQFMNFLKQTKLKLKK